ncbi:SigE family RNA polymerase sigma factor [Micromonospora sonneratiae]|uniref:SigE family RNA polymerase sigma factor n=1 Tax=Micromonospora sonneratiae TaxID=1184706 RepID=A0ABW3YBJ9_9ACTN
MADEQYPGLREFIAARGQALSRAAYLLTGDHGLAEDLVQSAMMRVLRHWKKMGDTGPEAYVRRIIYHLYLSRRRRRRVPELLTARVPELATTDPYLASTLRISLDRALTALSPRQRAVLVLRYYEDLTEADAAAVLNCSVGAVKRYAHEGLARLRQVAPHLVDFAPVVEKVGR